MQKGLWFFVILSVLLNLYFLRQNYERTRVVSVPDGDSLQLADGRRIRLLGIDAPERGRCMAEEARKELSGLVLRKHVRLKDTVTDDYGRVLASVFLGNQNINARLLEMGLAKNTYAVPALKPAGDVAKTKKVGIFSSVCRTTSTDCLIKGNVRDGKKTYHLPGCDNYTQVIVDEAFGDSWFCTEADAHAAGFVRASGCSRLFGDPQMRRDN